MIMEIKNLKNNVQFAQLKKSRTCFVCKFFCNIPLYKNDCFERYHVLKNYL